MEQQKSEYQRFLERYPDVAFNDSPGRRNKNTVLFAVETYSIHPSNFDPAVINQYRAYVSWNHRFLTEAPITVPTFLVQGFPLFDNFSSLDAPFPYDRKIDGISLICRYRKGGGLAGDIVDRRLEALRGITGMTRHCFGKIPYGDPGMYQGVIGDTVAQTYPSSLAKLRTLSWYRFHLCFENNYHEMWSHGYLTEKLLDCMKSGSLAVYLGAYNIESMVPAGTYVDFREFGSDYGKLSAALRDITPQQYADMTGKAWEYVKTAPWGRLADVEEVLKCALK